MEINKNPKEYGIALVKGVLGSIPGGSIVVELLNVTIPDKRMGRVEKLLLVLAFKGLNLDSEEIREKLEQSDECTDIFEDILHQTIRTFTDERFEYLASVLEQTLTEEEVKYNETKRLLSILKEINDVEIIILQSYEVHKNTDQIFKQKHQNIFKYQCISRNKETSKEEIEQNAIFNNYKNHLINLGLIGLNNAQRNSQLFLTPLGGMLLKKIGLEDKPIAIGKPLNPLSGIESAHKQYQQLKTDIEKNKPKDNYRKSQTQEVQEFVQSIQKALKYS